MQTLVFNTTTKRVEVTLENGKIITYDDVPTVGITESYYEVRQTDLMDEKRYPVFRAPIANTNMIIER